MASPFEVINGVVTYRGKPTNELTDEEKKELFGTAGDILNDPRYRERVQVGQGDAGFTEEEQVSQEAQQRLYRDGQWYRQVGALRSVGGEGEVSDPSNIVWDEELGWITPMSNVREYSGSVFTPAMLIAAGGMLAAVAATGGFAALGLGGGAAGSSAAGGAGGAAGGAGGGILGSGFPAGAGIAGPALETAGIASGAGTAAAGAGAAGTAAAGGSIFPAGAGIGVGGPLLETAGIATQVPATTQALANAGAFFSNLSPLSQRIIAGAVSSGASAILASQRQQQAQDFARQQQDIAYQRRLEEEERMREERRVRGTPQQYTFNVTPRAPRSGIIGGGMGG